MLSTTKPQVRTSSDLLIETIDTARFGKVQIRWANTFIDSPVILARDVDGVPELFPPSALRGNWPTADAARVFLFDVVGAGRHTVGAVLPRMDVKVGDLVAVVVSEGHRLADGSIQERPVVDTFRVESVDDLVGKKGGEPNRWCRGTVVDSTAGDRRVGGASMAHMGVVSVADLRDDVPVRVLS